MYLHPIYDILQDLCSRFKGEIFLPYSKINLSTSA